MPSKTVWKLLIPPALATSLLLVAVTAGRAQGLVDGFGGVYHPLNQRTPPGVAAHWSTVNARQPVYMQPIAVVLESPGTVTAYPREGAVSHPSPAQFGMAVGHTYRVKISDLAEFPGVELYPSVELLDRLHPPPGQVERYPIPVAISNAEIEWALEGRLVTKVIYLERPQTAAIRTIDEPVPTMRVRNSENVLAAADHQGRPMIILRLGGRVPDSPGDAKFFQGSGGPVAVPDKK